MDNWNFGEGEGILIMDYCWLKLVMAIQNRQSLNEYASTDY